MKKLICCVFALIGMIGLVMACNNGADHINFIGLLLFGFAAVFGTMYVKGELSLYLNKLVGFFRM
jgi:hypothetical protein